MTALFIAKTRTQLELLAWFARRIRHFNQQRPHHAVVLAFARDVCNNASFRVRMRLHLQQIVAANILGKLIGYHTTSSKTIAADVHQLAIWLEAYRRLVSFA